MTVHESSKVLPYVHPLFWHKSPSEIFLHRRLRLVLPETIMGSNPNRYGSIEIGRGMGDGMNDTHRHTVTT